MEYSRSPRSTERTPRLFVPSPSCCDAQHAAMPDLAFAPVDYNSGRSNDSEVALYVSRSKLVAMGTKEFDWCSVIESRCNLAVCID